MARRAVTPVRNQRRWPTASTIILYSVVILGSVATFVHSAWGFATIEAVLFEGIDFEALGTSGWFWVRGALAATTVDLGILGLVRLIQEGDRTRRTRISLVVVAILSGYTQFLYAVAHAIPVEPTVGVAPWLAGVAGFAAETRLLVLPWALPGLIILYGLTVGRKRAPEQPRHMSEEELLRIPPVTHGATPTDLTGVVDRDRLLGLE